MTNLDDCFAAPSERLPMAEALARLKARLRPLVGTENRKLKAAAGCILAESLVSDRDVPPFDNAALDGFAIAGSALAAAATTHRIIGQAAAGHAFTGSVTQGDAVRIFTGAPMPAGTDTVVMQEAVTVEDDRVTIPGGLKPGANRRKRGEDTRAGDTVLHPGRRLRPQDVALAASLGVGSLGVYRPLKVALFSTGDELVEPGQPARDDQIYDANRYLLAPMLAATGADVTDLGILADDADTVRAALQEAAAGHDVVLTSGGVSMGAEDHIVTTLKALGQVHFWQMAIKPGRPVAFGQIGEAAFVGLPGNPVAAAVCFLRFVRPVLGVLAGGIWQEAVHYPLPAAFSFDKKPGRREFLRGRLVTDADGNRQVANFPRQGSGIIQSLVDADGLIELGEDVTRVAPGDRVDFLPFAV